MVIEPQKKLPKKISFIIPCYNENPKILNETIRDLNSSLKKSKWVYEIIVVNDGSTKHKYTAVKGARLINHFHNKGYSASLKTGILNSKYSWIGITDADGTYPNKDAHKLIKFCGNYDMVVGLRDRSGDPLMRRFAKFYLRHFASFLANKHIPDLNSGLRVFRKDISERFWALFPEGFSFTSTLTMACFTNRIPVKYVPISYFKRKGKSTLKPISDTLRFFSLVTRLALYFNPMRFFVPLALIFLTFAFARGIRDYLLQDYFGGLTLVLFFLALQTLFFGLLSDLIIKRTQL
tara:strand:+ start:492 stop:1367 length:876 start_codon:yes stop_codon:yes gene_type:complete